MRCRILYPLCSWLACLLVHAHARAQHEPQGPFFDPDSLLRPSYELRVTLAYHDVTRDDFSQPLFLFAQPLRRIHARELAADVDLRVSVSESLALQAVLPLSLRSAETTFEGAIVSLDQQLPPSRRTLHGAGLSDPTLALAYRVLHGAQGAAFAELGLRIPLDDNPDGPVLPARLPLGTGQRLWFFGGGANLQLGRLGASLGYRLRYFPGSPATYLVRRVGPQSWTSGGLDAFIGHQLSASLRYTFDARWSLELAPELRVDQQPQLVDRDTTIRFIADTFRTELSCELALRLQLSAAHALELGYRQWLLHSFDDDPFFPISIPDQGIGLTWRATGS